MAVLGINVAGAIAYCAIVEAGIVDEAEPHKLDSPSGLSVSEGLDALANDVERLVAERAITRIVVVGSENNYTDTYAALTLRIGIETAILIAGARAGIPAERISRPDVRSRLGIPKSGKLADHSGAVLPKSGKIWKNKRDIAAMGALAGGSN